MKNTTKTLLIIVITAGLLVGGYLFVREQASVPDETTDRDEPQNIEQRLGATGTDQSEESDSGDISERTKNERTLELPSGQTEATIDIPSNLSATLSGWISDWQTVDSSISFDNFKFASEEEFAFPFNEVFLQDRPDTVPGFDDANVYSPDGSMYLNYLYDYESPGISSVVLVNPEGEDRVFRVAYCGNHCIYHGAYWLSDTKFVTTGLMEDTRDCGEGVPWEECPETLVFDVYDLESMKVAHFAYVSPIGDLKGSFPEAVCDDYPPCD